jgi:uncharacterized repeat protein (TIGR01451 family)
MKRSVRAVLAITLLAVCLGSQTHGRLIASSSDVVFTLVANVSNAIGIDWLSSGPYADQLLISLNWPSGQPNNFAHIDRNTGAAAAWGTHSGFANDEIYFATVRPGQGYGWIEGEMFSTEGTASTDALTHIARFAADGTLLDADFATLPGETKGKEGGIEFDRYGVAGGDLIVIASDFERPPSDVYRINSSGVVTHLVHFDEHVEGLTTIPNDPLLYGPWAGQILASNEEDAEFFTIDPNTGAMVAYGPTDVGLPDGFQIKGEDMWVIPANSSFYGVAFGTGNPSRILKADAAQWTSRIGQILVAPEDVAALYTIVWDPAANKFVSTMISAPSNWEHITFVPDAGVGDFVWLDLNANGQQDLGEPGLANVTVRLLDATGTTVLQTTTTDINGHYHFTVVGGTYVVQFVAPAGVYSQLTTADAAPDGSDSDPAQATGKTGAFTVAPGAFVDTIDAGFLPIDLSVTKDVNNTTPLVGTTVTFTITVSNAAGMSTATGVTVRDALPAGLSFVSATATAGSYSNGSSTWTVGTLAAGATATLTLKATVTVASTFTNVAEVFTADQFDRDSTPGNAASTHEDDDASVTLGSTNPQLPHTVTLRKSLLPSTDAGRFDLSINATTVVNQGNGGQVQVSLPAGGAVTVGEIANALNGAVLSNYASTLSCAGASLSSGGTTSGTFTMPDNDVICTLTNTRGALGGFTTYTQGGWGAPANGNNPGALLKANFATVYPSGVTIGGTKTLKFTASAAIEAFLPAGGKAGVLTASATNPTSSSAGVFAGQVLALRLSVDFSVKGLTKTGLSSMKLASGPLAGQTVQQVLALANSVLGGGALPSGMTISQLNDIVDKINNNFDGGTANGGYLIP